MTKTPLKVLIVEDSEEDTLLLTRCLTEGGYDLTHQRVQTDEGMKKALQSRPWDLVLADYSMPAFGGGQALRLLQKLGYDIPFIYVSGTLDMDSALEAVKAGARDYIPKNNLTRILLAIARELRRTEPARPAPAPPASDVMKPREATTVGGTDKPGILLVDDNPSNLAALHAVLSDLGEKLILATSGRQALEIMLTEEIAVILLDVRMPDMDGFETAELLRGREKNLVVPIIFLTAAGDRSEEVLRGYSVGAVDYLTKPFIPEIIRSKVAVFLELYRKSKELKTQAARLENLNSELEAFTNTASHDLRAPLRTIGSFAQILMEEQASRLDEEGRRCLERISAASRRMNNLLDDLLSYGHLNRGTISLERIELTWAVEEAVRQVEADVKEKSAEIKIEGTLPAAKGHPGTLVQVLVNLLSNALKYVPSGVKPRVRIGSEPRGGWVRIWVQDNGIGIAPKDQERIFIMFERLHSQHDYPGTGIGLAIVRKGMERLGGRAGVESKLGQGSRFWIEIPKADPS